MKAVMNLRVTENAGNFFTSCGPVNFSRRSLIQGVILVMLSLQAARANPPPPAPHPQPLSQRDAWPTTRYLYRRQLSVTNYGCGYGLCTSHNEERLVVVQHSAASGSGAARSSRRPVFISAQSHRLMF